MLERHIAGGQGTHAISSTLKPILIVANSITRKSKELGQRRPMVIDLVPSSIVRVGRRPSWVR
jgi:hypothetical protein